MTLLKREFNEAQDLVSIVIPAYNASSHIGDCLKSLVKQTYQNIEVVVVNDGSTDDTLFLINQYVQVDGRIHVYSQSNQGVSSARNLGISVATGSYISFVDADDIVSPVFIESLLFKMKKYYADVSICDVVTEIALLDDYITEKEDVYSYREALVTYFSNYGFDPTLKGKLFNKALLPGHLFDTEIKIGEDQLFFFGALRRAKRVIFDYGKLYWYQIREGSAMNSGFDERYLNMLDVNNRLSSIWNEDFPDLTELIIKVKALRFARKAQESVRTNTDVARCVGKLFIDEVKKIEYGRINKYCSFKEKVLFLMVKYLPLPIMKTYEFMNGRIK